ncbi:MAG: leucine-rich repeat domain-containing protein [Clostridia bacterium]|nr:leucine-rich repeat domain-containing protein [Clostridia bacterium]
MFEIENGVLKKYTGKDSKVAVPNGVTVIGEGAFEGCAEVETVTLPDGLKHIEGKAFADCQKLKQINIPNGLQTIGYVAFWWCDSLQKIHLPKSVGSIGEAAFFHCSQVKITAHVSLQKLPINQWNVQHRPIQWESTNEQEIQRGNFDIENGVLKGYHGKSAEVEIPYGVKEIAPKAFYENGDIKNVYLPETLEKIGDEAFFGCGGLKCLILPKNVVQAGKKAFAYCERLEWIILPLKLKKIGVDAFRFCRNVKIYAEAEKKPFGWGGLLGGDFNPDKRPVVWAYVTHEQRENARNFKIKNGRLQSYIGESAIVKIPYGVWLIEQKAFKEKHITNVEFPYGLSCIEDEAFFKCALLKKLVFPDTLKEIGKRAFSYCASLESIKMGSGELTVDEFAFSICNHLKAVYITDIKAWCNVKGVKELTDNRAELYLNDQLMRKVVIPAGITKLEDCIFRGSTTLECVEIGSAVTTIAEYALSGCCALSNITVDIKNNHYRSIDGNLYSKDGTRLIRYAEGKKEKTFSLPDSVTIIDKTAFYNCKMLENIEVSKGNSTYQSIDGALYTKDGMTLIKYPQAKSEGSFSIPYGVTTIAKGACTDCTLLKFVEIPNSVRIIEKNAFERCNSLGNVIMSNNLTTLGACAFSKCIALKKILIPESVTEMGYWVFDECDLLTIYCRAKNQPGEWPSDWKCMSGGYCTVIWGYTGINQ